MIIKNDRIKVGLHCGNDIKIDFDYLYFFDSGKNKHKVEILEYNYYPRTSILEIKTNGLIKNDILWKIEINYVQLTQFNILQRTHKEWLFKEKNIKYLVGIILGLPIVTIVTYILQYLQK